MTKEQIRARLLELLALQEQITPLTDALAQGLKELTSLQELKGQKIVFERDGSLYELSYHPGGTAQVENARRHGGFYLNWRFTKIPHPY